MAERFFEPVSGSRRRGHVERAADLLVEEDVLDEALDAEISAESELT